MNFYETIFYMYEFVHVCEKKNNDYDLHHVNPNSKMPHALHCKIYIKFKKMIQNLRH